MWEGLCIGPEEKAQLLIGSDLLGTLTTKEYLVWIQ